MSNWLQRPSSQHLLSCLSAIGAGVVLPWYFPQHLLLTGVSGAVGGVAGNLLSTFVQKFFDRRENNPTLPDINGDLLSLIANAIAKEIADFSREETSLPKAERRRASEFTNKVAAAFEEIIQNEELPNIAPPDVTRLLAHAAQDKLLPAVGTIEDWRRLVGRLNTKREAQLNISTMVLLAKRLHEQLWESIRSELKKDFTADGRAYAALHLSFMSEVLAQLQTLVALPQEQSQLTRELLAELRTHKAQQADVKERAIVAALTPEDRTHVAAFTQRFEQLSTQLDAQFGQVLNKLEEIGGKLDTLVEQHSLVDKLLSRVSEKDQEIGRLRADLEAALQRVAQAGARGDPEASTVLAQLRRDGDPQALGAFLEQELAEKQPDVIALLRERAAVAYVAGEIERAEQCLRQILATLPDDLAATNQLGHIYRLRGDLAAAHRQYQRLLDLAPDDQAVKAMALGNLGLIYKTRGQLDEAERLHREALEIEKKLGHLVGQASDLGNLGVIYKTRGQLDEAERLYREALEINEKLGRLEGQANQLGNLGVIAEDCGDLITARRLWTEARDLFTRVGARPQQQLMQGWLDALPPL